MSVDLLIGADVQVFTSGSSNWSKPAWATLVHVILYGAGGGGGGGDTAGSTTAVTGGGGGGGGGRADYIFKASALGNTEPYSVGAAGSSGSAGTGSGGGNGTAGGNSTFGGNVLAQVITAYGGGRGSGG